MFFYRKRVAPEQVNLSLLRGISALLSMQQPDGSFPVYKRVRLKPWKECHSLFSTVTVLLAVASLLPDQAVSKAVNFILNCRRDDGTWVFDPDYGIPVDSDDTACSLAALARYDISLVNNADVNLLRSFWRLDGGPFRTWQADGVWSGRDHDDAVVNCNILHALNELGTEPTHGEVNAVLNLIQGSIDGCRYYCSPLTIGYAAIRAGLAMESLPVNVTNRPIPENGILPTAQWLSIVRQWDENAVAYLISRQSKKGHWTIESWFTGIAKPIPVWGSSAISTALCIEALHYSIRGITRAA